MAREAVAEILEKDIIHQMIDIHRNIGGREMMDDFTAGRRAGNPWFVILEPDGSAVVDSFGPNGNIGFPVTDEEIATFGVIMRKAAVNITASDVDKLLKSLVEEREARRK